MVKKSAIRKPRTLNRGPVNPSEPNPPFPPLESPCKNVFPFKLACPSFIYRAGYTDNVRCLSPFVDEIELLFFESRFPDSLPPRPLIDELGRLAQQGRTSFNVHLPTDIYPGHPHPGVRHSAVVILNEWIGRCGPLNPSTFTLHLNRDTSETDPEGWQTRTGETLAAVLANGLPGPRISVENIDYDFALVAPVVEDLDLSVCMDMGHLMVRGISLEAFFERWRGRITTIHLHGVDGDQDHLPLNRLSEKRMAEVIDVLEGFSGVVSLEVFSFQALNASMGHLLDQWNH